MVTVFGVNQYFEHEIGTIQQGPARLSAASAPFRVSWRAHNFQCAIHLSHALGLAYSLVVLF
jgi:hypothetical protein